ncbi:hypothetical protein FD44_GL001359 [Secundilactobacillus malefermentans DSM 5705 = KCTC 3548]|uniref:hypothetical protein n=1 Tax=Secundilactobacillus malefermentans TaxID=176292 RepID=UPI0002F9C518|nr:hypothetical protein [Secundilactobacillus malefermentans]KRM57156.1 hypothetical protein FD44_GL001359 [Secundilactobacillus malefermentans DSM 5705 = KCTC 3548]
MPVKVGIIKYRLENAEMNWGIDIKRFKGSTVSGKVQRLDSQKPILSMMTR